MTTPDPSVVQATITGFALVRASIAAGTIPPSVLSQSDMAIVFAQDDSGRWSYRWKYGEGRDYPCDVDAAVAAVSAAIQLLTQYLPGRAVSSA